MTWQSTATAAFSRGGGSAAIPGTGVSAIAVKLDGTSGAELWRWTGPPTASYAEGVFGLAVHSSGDVFIAGQAGGSFLVARLSGADGSELWRHTRTDASQPYAAEVVIEAGGDLVVTGRDQGHAVVTKLAAVDGQEVWTAGITDPAWLDSAVGSPQLDANNDVIACGYHDLPLHLGFLVATPQDRR